MDRIDTEKLMNLTEKTLLDNVSLGLVLASAMSWNEVIKVFASKFVKNGGSEWYLVMYAVFLTLLMVVLQMVSKRPVKKTLQL
tara:strand:+ start:7011 stop:7259 length:249 start_codon:yes stop_codon:yes gene_type:complete